MLSASLDLSHERAYRSVQHSPLEGIYESESNNGRGNTKDVFVFMTDTNLNVVNARGDTRAGSGQMYIFQFPVDYFVSGNSSSLSVLPIGSIRGYQAYSSPGVAYGGQKLYWNMVRGEVRGWINQRYSRGHSGSLNLGRGDPAYIAGRASPTVSNGGSSVFGPAASNAVWKSDQNLVNLTLVEIDAVVSSRLAVTEDDAYVVYGTQAGTLVSAESSALGIHWSVSTFNPIRGDLALDDTHIYVYVLQSAKANDD